MSMENKDKDRFVAFEVEDMSYGPLATGETLEQLKTELTNNMKNDEVVLDDDAIIAIYERTHFVKLKKEVDFVFCPPENVQEILHRRSAEEDPPEDEDDPMDCYP